MEKRLPLALILSFAFVVLYTSSFKGSASRDPGPVDGEPSVGARDNPALPRGNPAAGPGARSAPQPSTGGADEQPPVEPEFALAEAPLLTEELDTRATVSVWTSRGAGLSQLDLKSYHPTIDSDEVLPLLSSLDGEKDNLLLRDVRGLYGLDQVNWDLRRERTDDGLVRLVFTHTTPDGLLFTRTVTERFDDYVVDLRIDVTNQGSTRVDTLSLSLQGARGLVDLATDSAMFIPSAGPTALAIVRNKMGENDPRVWRGGDLDGDSRAIGGDERLLSAGVINNYFAAVLVPRGDTDVRQVLPSSIFDAQALERAVAERQPRDEREAEAFRYELASDYRNNAAADLSLMVLSLDIGETQSFEFELYAGPKSSDIAELPGYGYLTDVIEVSYGMGAWINRSLLNLLRFFYGIVGNWGAAIILLTLVVKALLFPLNRKQQTGMTKYSAAMQRLKPRLDELKKKHKNNKRKFQEEQMKLLKSEGVSPPLGGCLLMFLQFPVWISLFQILREAIELRQSSFVFWITDLSRPDQMPFGLFGFETLNLLPILMAAATIVQMRFQPKPADESQAQTQKIMGMIMPIFMLVILYGYSSGLSLYILTSSLIGIFEYQVIRRIWPIEGASSRTPAPA